MGKSKVYRNSVHKYWKLIVVLGIITTSTVFSALVLISWVGKPPLVVSAEDCNSLVSDYRFEELYIGTPDGIKIHDRYTGKYEMTDRPYSGLYDNYILRLEIPNNRFFLFALIGSGTTRIAYRSIVLSNSSWNNATPNVPVGTNIFDFDVNPDGTLLYIASNFGLIIYNIDSQTTQILNGSHHEALAFPRVVSVVSNYLLVGYSRGIAVMNRANLNITHMEIPYSDSYLQPTCFASTPTLDKIFIGTRKGLTIAGYSNGNLTHYPELGLGVPPLPNHEIKAMEIGSTGQLFIGTSDGFCWYDTISNEYGGSLTSRIGFENERVQSFYYYGEGGQSQLFVGTHTGVYSIDTSNTQPGGRLYEYIPNLLYLNSAVMFSFIAILISLYTYFDQKRLRIRIGDFKALNVLRNCIDFIEEPWTIQYAIGDPSVPVQYGTESIDREITTIENDTKALQESIALAMSEMGNRFFPDVFEISELWRNLDYYHIAQYRIRNTNTDLCTNLPDEWSLKQFLGLKPPAGENLMHNHVAELKTMITTVADKLEKTLTRKWFGLVNTTS